MAVGKGVALATHREQWLFWVPTGFKHTVIDAPRRNDARHDARHGLSRQRRRCWRWRRCCYCCQRRRWPGRGAHGRCGRRAALPVQNSIPERALWFTRWLGESSKVFLAQLERRVSLAAALEALHALDERAQSSEPCGEAREDDTQKYSEVLGGTQKTSEGHQRAIRGHHQRSSEGHQRAIRGHHQRSSPAEKDERPSNWLTMIDRSFSTWLNAPVDCVITPSSTEPANMDSEMMSSGSAKYGQRDHDHQQEAIRGHQRDHQRGNQRLSGRPPPAK